MRTTDSRNCIDVNNFQCWICRRLRPNHLRLARFRCALERCGIAHINKDNLESLRTLTHALQQSIRAAIHIVHAHDRLTRIEQFQACRNCRKSTGECESTLRAIFFFCQSSGFQICKASFERKPCHIMTARIFESFVHPRGLLNEC